MQLSAHPHRHTKRYDVRKEYYKIYFRLLINIGHLLLLFWGLYFFLVH